MNLPQGPRGTLVASGLLFILLALLTQLALLPAWRYYRALDEEIETTRERLVRFQRLADRLPALERRARSGSGDEALRPYLLQGRNPALAGAELQRRLKGVVSSHQGRLLSMRILKPQADGPFERIAVNARVQITLPGLQALLYELETGQPLLFVDSLNLIMRRTRARRGAASPRLEAQLTLYGLRGAGAADG